MDFNIDHIRACFKQGRVRYSDHALDEMRSDEFGRIYDDDVIQSLMNGEIIEEYPNAFPWPACLVYGENADGRLIHTVFGYNSESERTTVVTVYHPNPDLWIAYKTRRNK